MSNVLTIEDWLNQWPDELRHEIASQTRPKRDTNYSIVGSVEFWGDFSSPRIHANPVIEQCLAAPCSSPWVPYVGNVARQICNERQLDNLYSTTLITRVSIALEASRAVCGGPQMTIVVGLGSFESWVFDDQSRRHIKPDWVVLEGDYRDANNQWLTAQQLVDEGKIAVVGETKISRNAYGETLEKENIIPGTLSCDESFLSQLQQYAVMTKTRFGFILTETEIIVAQFLRENEASPRERGDYPLRQQEQLSSPSPEPNTAGNISITHDQHGESVEPPTPLLPASVGHRKRRRANTSPEAPRATVSLVQESTADSDDSAEMASPQASSDPSSSPQVLLTSSQSYQPTIRDYDIDRVLVRSFPISQPTGSAVVDNRDDTSRNLYPSKALFALIKLAEISADERGIGTEEIGFHSSVESNAALTSWTSLPLAAIATFSTFEVE